jgi:dedicator of cytokinesis protein 3
VFESGPAIDDRFHSKVAIFLDEIELFIALLENVRELPETPEWADERAAATFQMLDFIRRIGRDGLYVRFVHQLKGIFVREKNWLAAGLTLKLHADLYDWRAEGDLVDRCTEGDLNLPAQTSFARKEAIYRHCLEYFGESIPLISPDRYIDISAEAQAYEQALEMADELCSQHRKITWDVSKISELLAYQAKLWDQIRLSRRQKPEYYRVVS